MADRGGLEWLKQLTATLDPDSPGGVPREKLLPELLSKLHDVEADGFEFPQSDHTASQQFAIALAKRLEQLSWIAQQKIESYRSWPVTLKRQLTTTLLDLVTKSRNNMQDMAQDDDMMQKVFKDHLVGCGDYAVQVDLAEILYRCGRNQLHAELLPQIFDSEGATSFQNLLKMTPKNLDLSHELRRILVAYNSSLGSVATVHSYQMTATAVSLPFVKITENWVDVGAGQLTFPAIVEEEDVVIELKQGIPEVLREAYTFHKIKDETPIQIVLTAAPATARALLHSLPVDRGHVWRNESQGIPDELWCELSQPKPRKLKMSTGITVYGKLPLDKSEAGKRSWATKPHLPFTKSSGLGSGTAVQKDMQPPVETKQSTKETVVTENAAFPARPSAQPWKWTKAPGTATKAPGTAARVDKDAGPKPGQDISASRMRSNMSHETSVTGAPQVDKNAGAKPGQDASAGRMKSNMSHETSGMDAPQVDKNAGAKPGQDVSAGRMKSNMSRETSGMDDPVKQGLLPEEDGQCMPVGGAKAGQDISAGRMKSKMSHEQHETSVTDAPAKHRPLPAEDGPCMLVRAADKEESRKHVDECGMEGDGPEVASAPIATRTRRSGGKQKEAADNNALAPVSALAPVDAPPPVRRGKAEDGQKDTGSLQPVVQEPGVHPVVQEPPALAGAKKSTRAREDSSTHSHDVTVRQDQIRLANLAKQDLQPALADPVGRKKAFTPSPMPKKLVGRRRDATGVESAQKGSSPIGGTLARGRKADVSPLPATSNLGSTFKTFSRTASPSLAKRNSDARLVGARIKPSCKRESPDVIEDSLDPGGRVKAAENSAKQLMNVCDAPSREMRLREDKTSMRAPPPPPNSPVASGQKHGAGNSMLGGKQTITPPPTSFRGTTRQLAPTHPVASPYEFPPDSDEGSPVVQANEVPDDGGYKKDVQDDGGYKKGAPEDGVYKYDDADAHGSPPKGSDTDHPGPGKKNPSSFLEAAAAADLADLSDQGSGSPKLNQHPTLPTKPGGRRLPIQELDQLHSSRKEAQAPSVAALPTCAPVTTREKPGSCLKLARHRGDEDDKPSTPKEQLVEKEHDSASKKAKPQKKAAAAATGRGGRGGRKGGRGGRGHERLGSHPAPNPLASPARQTTPNISAMKVMYQEIDKSPLIVEEESDEKQKRGGTRGPGPPSGANTTSDQGGSANFGMDPDEHQSPAEEHQMADLYGLDEGVQVNGMPSLALGLGPQTDTRSNGSKRALGGSAVLNGDREDILDVNRVHILDGSRGALLDIRRGGLADGSRADRLGGNRGGLMDSNSRGDLLDGIRGILTDGSRRDLDNPLSLAPKQLLKSSKKGTSKWNQEWSAGTGEDLDTEPGLGQIGSGLKTNTGLGLIGSGLKTKTSLGQIGTGLKTKTGLGQIGSGLKTKTGLGQIGSGLKQNTGLGLAGLQRHRDPVPGMGALQNYTTGGLQALDPTYASTENAEIQGMDVDIEEDRGLSAKRARTAFASLPRLPGLSLVGVEARSALQAQRQVKKPPAKEKARKTARAGQGMEELIMQMMKSAEGSDEDDEDGVDNTTSALVAAMAQVTQAKAAAGKRKRQAFMQDLEQRLTLGIKNAEALAADGYHAIMGLDKQSDLEQRLTLGIKNAEALAADGYRAVVGQAQESVASLSKVLQQKQEEMRELHEHFSRLIGSKWDDYCAAYDSFEGAKEELSAQSAKHLAGMKRHLSDLQGEAAYEINAAEKRMEQLNAKGGGINPQMASFLKEILACS
eukprot:gene29249-12494_t